MVRIGERWVEALRDVVDGELTVHRGPWCAPPWSELVCFAGIAPGEVLLDGVKLVGLSQRRTRRGARFQCAVNRHFDDDLLIELLAAPVADATPAGRHVAADRDRHRRSGSLDGVRAAATLPSRARAGGRESAVERAEACRDCGWWWGELVRNG